MILDSLNKSLEIKLGGVVSTNQLPFVLGYVDILSSTQAVSAVGANDGVTSDTTAVVILAAPASGHTRVVRFLSIKNLDTSLVTLTLQLNNAGVRRTIIEIDLSVGDNLIYTDD